MTLLLPTLVNSGRVIGVICHGSVFHLVRFESAMHNRRHMDRRLIAVTN